jgi:SAM-dependent methyltransferase
MTGFIAESAKRAEQIQELGSLCKSIADACWQLSPGSLPPLDMMQLIGSHDQHHFRSNMISIFNELFWRGLLRPEKHIIDLGCGCGRLAIPISRLVTSGRYIGIDAWDGGIKWCSDNITPTNPRCEFYHVKTDNNYYLEDWNPAARNRYHLDYIDISTIDTVFAISLFSHLTKVDTSSYLQELNRVLKQDGIIYITGFVIDEFFLEHQRKGNHTGLKEDEPGCYYGYRGQDFFAGYTLERWRSMLSDAGLRILSFELGSWAQKPGARPYQDTFIIGKAPVALAPAAL